MEFNEMSLTRMDTPYGSQPLAILDQTYNDTHPREPPHLQGDPCGYVQFAWHNTHRNSYPKQRFSSCQPMAASAPIPRHYSRGDLGKWDRWGQPGNLLYQVSRHRWKRIRWWCGKSRSEYVPCDSHLGRRLS